MRTHPAARLVIIVSVLLTLFLPSAVPRYLQPVRHPSSRHYFFSTKPFLRSSTGFGPFHFGTPNPSPDLKPSLYPLQLYRHSPHSAKHPIDVRLDHYSFTTSIPNNNIRIVAESPSEPDILFNSFNPSLSLSPSQAPSTFAWSQFVSNQPTLSFTRTSLPSEPPSPSINAASSLLPSFRTSSLPSISSDPVRTEQPTVDNSEVSPLFSLSSFSRQPLDVSPSIDVVSSTTSSTLDFAESLQPSWTLELPLPVFSYSPASWSSSPSESALYNADTVLPYPSLIASTLPSDTPYTTVFGTTDPLNGDSSISYSHSPSISTRSALASMVPSSTSTMVLQISESPRILTTSTLDFIATYSQFITATSEVTPMITTNRPTAPSFDGSATEVSVDVTPSDRFMVPSLPAESPLSSTPENSLINTAIENTPSRDPEGFILATQIITPAASEYLTYSEIPDYVDSPSESAEAPYYPYHSVSFPSQTFRHKFSIVPAVSTSKSSEGTSEAQLWTNAVYPSDWSPTLVSSLSFSFLPSMQSEELYLASITPTSSDSILESFSAPVVQLVNETPDQEPSSTFLFATAATSSIQVTVTPSRSKSYAPSPSPAVSLVDGSTPFEDRYSVSASPQLSSLYGFTSFPTEASTPPAATDDGIEPSISKDPDISDVSIPEVFETSEILSSFSLSQTPPLLDVTPTWTEEIPYGSYSFSDFSVPQSSSMYKSEAPSESLMPVYSESPVVPSLSPIVSLGDISPSPIDSFFDETHSLPVTPDYLITPELLQSSEAQLYPSVLFHTSENVPEGLTWSPLASSESLPSASPHVWESEQSSISLTLVSPSIILYSQDTIASLPLSSPELAIVSSMQPTNINFQLSSHEPIISDPTDSPLIGETFLPSPSDAPFFGSFGTSPEGLLQTPDVSDQFISVTQTRSDFATVSPSVSRVLMDESLGPIESPENTYESPSMSFLPTNSYLVVQPGKTGKSERPTVTGSVDVLSEEPSNSGQHSPDVSQFPSSLSISNSADITPDQTEAVSPRLSVATETVLPSFQVTFSLDATEPQFSIALFISDVPDYAATLSFSMGPSQSEDVLESVSSISPQLTMSGGISPEISNPGTDGESFISAAISASLSSDGGLNSDVSDYPTSESVPATPIVSLQYEVDSSYSVEPAFSEAYLSVSFISISSSNFYQLTPVGTTTPSAEVPETVSAAWTNDYINQDSPSFTILASQSNSDLSVQQSSPDFEGFTPEISVPVTETDSPLVSVPVASPGLSETDAAIPSLPMDPSGPFVSQDETEPSEFPRETLNFGILSDLPVYTADFASESTAALASEDSTLYVISLYPSSSAIMSHDFESPEAQNDEPSPDMSISGTAEGSLESWSSPSSGAEAPTFEIAEGSTSGTPFAYEPTDPLLWPTPANTETLLVSALPSSADDFPSESIQLLPSDSLGSIDSSPKPLLPSFEVQASMLAPSKTFEEYPEFSLEIDQDLFVSSVPSLSDFDENDSVQPSPVPASSFSDSAVSTMYPTPEEPVFDSKTSEPSIFDVPTKTVSTASQSSMLTNSPTLELDEPSISSLIFPSTSAEAEFDTLAPSSTPSITTVSPDVIPVPPKPPTNPGDTNGDSDGQKSPSPGAEVPNSQDGGPSSGASSGGGLPGGAGGISVIAIVSVFAVLVIGAILYKTCAVIPSINTGFAMSSIFGSSDDSNGRSGSDADLYQDGVSGDDSPWDQVWRSATDLPEGTQREGEAAAARVGGEFAGLLKPGAARVRPPQVITRLAIPGMCMALSQLSPGSGSSVMSVTTGFSSGPLPVQQTSIMEEDASIGGTDYSEEKPVAMNFDMLKNLEAPKVDLLFVLDASGSLSWRDYRHIKELITKPRGLVDEVMRRANDGSRVGFIEYAYDSVVVSELDRDQDLVRRRILSAFQGDANNWDHDGMFIYEVGGDEDGNALRKVDSLVDRENAANKRKGDSPTIQAKEVPPAMNGMSREAHLALKWSRFEMLPPVANRRIQAQLQRAVRLRRVVVVNGGELTKGGQPNGGLEAALSEKNKMERAGIRIITVGIGDGFERNLKKLATRKYHLVAKSVKDLEKTIGRLTDMVLRADMKNDGKFALHPPSILIKKRKRQYRSKQHYALYRGIGTGKMDPVKSISKGLPRRASELPPWFTDGLS